MINVLDNFIKYFIGYTVIKIKIIRSFISTFGSVNIKIFEIFSYPKYFPTYIKYFLIYPKYFNRLSHILGII